jgi:hypothetical protein
MTGGTEAKRKPDRGLQLNFRQTVEERTAMLDAIQLSDGLYRGLTDFARGAIRREIERIRYDAYARELTRQQRVTYDDGKEGRA